MNSNSHFDVDTMLKRLSIFANISPTEELDDDADEEEEEIEENDEVSLNEISLKVHSKNKFEDIITNHNKDKYSKNDDNEYDNEEDELTVTKKNFNAETTLNQKDNEEEDNQYSDEEKQTYRVSYEEYLKKNSSNCTSDDFDLMQRGNTAKNNNEMLTSLNENYFNPISINTDLDYTNATQLSPNQQIYEIANELDRVNKEKDKLQEELNNQKFKEKFDAERIQMLTKENETLKCELYHIKKMQSEVQSEGETNSGVFLKQIESLRNENNRLNEYLKQTEIQVKQLENQLGKLKRYEAMFKSIDLIQINQNLYQLINKIGKGGFSDVFCCISFKDKKTYALKKVTLKDLGTSETNQVLNEIELLKKLKSSDKVIQLIDHEYRPNEKLLYVVMEIGACDLNVIFKKEIKKFGCVKEPKRVFYWQKMLEAVLAIHELGVIHSDLKPSNFLVVNDEIKLIDFNISNDTNERTSITIQTECGTIEYMAPETFLKDSDEKSKMNKKVDVWSMGVILYLLTYGKLPLQHIKNQMKKMYFICDPNQQEITFSPTNNPNLDDTLKKCFAFKPEDRYDVNQLLSHSYITSIS